MSKKKIIIIAIIALVAISIGVACCVLLTRTEQPDDNEQHDSEQENPPVADALTIYGDNATYDTASPTNLYFGLVNLTAENVCVKINDKEIDKTYYHISNNYSSLTLRKEFLATLLAGEYTISISANDENSSTTFVVKGGPQLNEHGFCYDWPYALQRDNEEILEIIFYANGSMSAWNYTLKNGEKFNVSTAYSENAYQVNGEVINTTILDKSLSLRVENGGKTLSADDVSMNIVVIRPAALKQGVLYMANILGGVATDVGMRFNADGSVDAFQDGEITSSTPAANVQYFGPFISIKQEKNGTTRNIALVIYPDGSMIGNNAFSLLATNFAEPPAPPVDASGIGDDAIASGLELNEYGFYFNQPYRYIDGNGVFFEVIYYKDNSAATWDGTYSIVDGDTIFEYRSGRYISEVDTPYDELSSSFSNNGYNLSLNGLTLELQIVEPHLLQEGAKYQAVIGERTQALSLHNTTERHPYIQESNASVDGDPEINNILNVQYFANHAVATTLTGDTTIYAFHPDGNKISNGSVVYTIVNN